MRLSLLTCVAVLSLSMPVCTPAYGQKQCTDLAKHTPAFFYCDLIDKVQSGPNPAKAAGDLAQFFTDTQTLPAALGYSQLDAIFQHAQDTRPDKQTGAPASANGSTNLVSLPGATSLLSVAVASGALTQTSSGTTTTIGANVGQTFATLAKSNAFDYTLKGLPVLGNIDATISLGDTAGSGTSVPITGSGSGTSGTAGSVTLGSTNYSVTGATARYQFYNRFDPHTSQFKNAFLQSMQTNTNALKASKSLVAATSGALVKHFEPEAADSATLGKEKAEFLAAGSTQAVIDLFNSYFAAVRAKASIDPSFKTDLAGFASAMGADLSLYRQIVDTAKGIPAITAEYTYTNTPNQPPIHSARLIVGFQSTNGMMLSLNGAADFYGGLSKQTQTSHFRDFQIAAQGDIPIAPDATRNAIDLSVATYGQYQQAASLLTVDASSLPSGFPANSPAFVAGTQGWLGVAQIKLTLRGPNGIQIVPVSWKWSNRTSLFTQSDSSFQFGLSYDISSLSQLFGAQ